MNNLTDRDAEVVGKLYTNGSWGPAQIAAYFKKMQELDDKHLRRMKLMKTCHNKAMKMFTWLALAAVVAMLGLFYAGAVSAVHGYRIVSLILSITAIGIPPAHNIAQKRLHKWYMAPWYTLGADDDVPNHFR